MPNYVAAADVAPVLSGGDISVERAAYVGLSKFHRWRAGFNGFGAVPDVMASPPTVTVGAAAGNSTIGGSTTVGIGRDDTRLTKLGGAFVDSSGYKAGTKVGVRYRWLVDGTFDMKMKSYLGQSQYTLLIDGKPVSKARNSVDSPGMNDDTEHFILCEFGADTLSYELANPVKLAGGSGYVVGEVITLTGGTFSTAAQVRVTAVNAGAVTAAAVHRAGVYSVAPATMSQGSTSGSGTGATFTTALGKLHTTKRMRTVELILGFGTKFAGLNVGGGISVLPWPENTDKAKLMMVGDSFIENLHGSWAGGNWTRQMAYMLGLQERFVQYGTSGQGFVRGSTLLSAEIASIISQAPDMLGLAEGINDMFQWSDIVANEGAAGLTAAVTARLNELLTGLPKVRIVGIGPYADTTAARACTVAIAAGYAAASDPTRVAFYDFGATGAYTLTGGGSGYTSTDGTHPGQTGMDMLASVLAPPIASAFLALA
jgi:lysophospholipase L1-like esterase